MTTEKKEKKQDFPALEETLYRLNGTLCKEGDTGAALGRIADALELIGRELQKQSQCVSNLSWCAKETNDRAKKGGVQHEII